MKNMQMNTGEKIEVAVPSRQNPSTFATKEKKKD
jgi:hypothetical protein